MPGASILRFFIAREKEVRSKLLISAIAAAAFATSASATTMIEMSLEDLAADAAIVVVGDVVDTAFVKKDGGTYTEATINVSDAVVGSPASQITVSVPGGLSKHGKFQVYESSAGAPLFVRGGEALLFLSAVEAGQYEVVGFSQGAFAVSTSVEGKIVRLPDNDGNAETLVSAKQRIRAARAANGGKRGLQTTSE